MPRIQTFLRKGVFVKFEEYRERNKLSPYEALANLVELGLNAVEQGKTADSGGTEGGDWGGLRPEAEGEGRTVYVVKGREIITKRR